MIPEGWSSRLVVSHGAQIESFDADGVSQGPLVASDGGPGRLRRVASDRAGGLFVADGSRILHHRPGAPPALVTEDLAPLTETTFLRTVRLDEDF